ncbi:MAG TPA: response regulator transcription factor [Prolixibacteraceae bacterium]|nr:response regulator transcription factor [Prolixibacteraceae bacterium]
MTQPCISLILVDDHKLFREGVKYALEKEKEFSILAEASDGIEFLEQIDRFEPDVVLMDIDMPRMNGIDATQRALGKCPEMNILILSMHGDQNHYRKMIELGVKGFLLKDSGADQLRTAIREVARGNHFFSQELLMNIILKKETTPTGEQLKKALDISEREFDVLQLLCKAYSNQQIADTLFISSKTVEGHKTRLMLKTDTQNSVALVLFAIKNQLVIV